MKFEHEVYLIGVIFVQLVQPHFGYFLKIIYDKYALKWDKYYYHKIGFNQSTVENKCYYFHLLIQASVQDSNSEWLSLTAFTDMKVHISHILILFFFAKTNKRC